jgi:MFS family permease
MDRPQNMTYVLIVATMGGSFMASSINIALPRIATELAMDALSMSWVATAFILASVVFIIPFGRIADIYGRKKIFLYGVSIFTLTSFALIFANSAIVLIVLRFIQGISGSMLVGTSVAIVTWAYPREVRGGLWVSMLELCI